MIQGSLLTVAALIAALTFSGFTVGASADETPAIDTAKIETKSGLKGSFNKEENVFKVSKPRADADAAVRGSHVMGGVHTGP
jgi:hypothetical protein